MNIAEKIFHLDMQDYPAWKKAGVRIGQFLVGFWSEFNRDKCLVRAQGLAYACLLALVPLTAVIFAMFAAFSSFNNIKESVQDFLFSQLLPTRQGEIMEYINQFTANTSKLGFYGSLVLIVTSVLLLDNIEKNFNEIWTVKNRRSFWAKVTSYTSVLIFGSLFMGASVSVSAKVKALIQLDNLMQISFISMVSLWLFPIFATFLAFLVMYMVVPYTKVKLKSAAVGAIVGSLLWEFAKNALGSSVWGSVKYNAIYGSLALIPIFLIWLYITWVIVLIGLEFTYTHQNFKALIANRTYRDPAGRDKIKIALKLFAYLASQFHKGNKPPSIDELADRFEMPLDVTAEYVGILLDRDLIREVAGEDDGFVPARSLEQIQVSDVIRAIFNDVKEMESVHQPLDETAEKTVEEFEAAGFKAIGDMRFLDYLKKF